MHAAGGAERRLTAGLLIKFLFAAKGHFLPVTPQVFLCIFSSRVMPSAKCFLALHSTSHLRCRSRRRCVVIQLSHLIKVPVVIFKVLLAVEFRIFIDATIAVTSPSPLWIFVLLYNGIH